MIATRIEVQLKANIEEQSESLQIVSVKTQAHDL
jgi:hypothetical protein